MSLLLYIIIYLLSSTFGLMLLKSGLATLDLNSFATIIKQFTNLQFVFGVALYALSFVVWMLIISRKDLSYVYPIVVGLGYVSVMVMSTIVLKESLTLGKIIGGVVICIGIIIITLQK